MYVYEEHRSGFLGITNGGICLQGSGSLGGSGGGGGITKQVILRRGEPGPGESRGYVHRALGTTLLGSSKRAGTAS